MDSIYATGACSISVPDEDEQTVTMPLSLYKELIKVYKRYRQYSHDTYLPLIPDPIVPDYTRPQPNDWPQKTIVWC